MKKHTRRKVYRLVDPVAHAIAGAALTDTASLDKLRLIELSAIESFRTGCATKDDWRAIADMVNVCETFANDGVGPEALPSCQAAEEALGDAHRRWQEHGHLGVTGPQLQALRDCFEYHDLQRSSVSRSRYERAIQTTINRIVSAHPSVKVCV